MPVIKIDSNVRRSFFERLFSFTPWKKYKKITERSLILENEVHYPAKAVEEVKKKIRNSKFKRGT